ncbi:MAG: hypothetical protein J6R48_08760 [Muribaculaceae bacterium]|nr:hypothetical protein [Muribaculaceae bacterium]
MKHIIKTILLICIVVLTTGCETIDNRRIPALSVNIRLDNTGLWNTYGVGGFGIYRYFIRETREPHNFPFTEATYTGYGGVLLIGGMDPVTAETNVPLAYDLACPVECKRDIRVVIDDSNLDAVCPMCGSRYDVISAGGAPIAGEALTGEVKYRLQPYNCIPSPAGGYIITR